MRYSKNVIEETWLAWAFARPASPAVIDRSLERVGSHYRALISDPVELASAGDGSHGVAVWEIGGRRGVGWPLLAREGELVLAASSIPTGWSRLVGELDPSEAAIPLARALARAPDRAGELNPAFALAVRDGNAGRLTILSDVVGAGRLYEMSSGDCTVWSNRLGALPLFAGVRPRADQEAWRIFAACGWFLGQTTPIEGASKVRPGAVVEVVRAEDGTTRIERRESRARARLVEPRRRGLRGSAPLAAEHARGLAADLAAARVEPLAVSLSGGRDSRVSAAAAIAAGVDATYNTGNQVPGEVEVVRELIAAAPATMDHTVNSPAGEGDVGALWERAEAIHLVHDGMRNPQEIRRPTEIPHSRALPATLSGHGGELGHGFYYGKKAKLRRLRRGRDRALIAQLDRTARRHHSAAVEQAYAEYMEHCEAVLDEGRAIGLRGPVLLDWFYLAERLPYRSGLGARSARGSACVTPGFIRAAFDLSPRQRLQNKLHNLVISTLVPEWSRIGYFSDADTKALPTIKRARIWEIEADAEVLSEVIAERRGWEGMFDPARVEAMWSEVRDGGGSADYEHIFDRMIWKAGFDRHLELLGDRAAAR